MPIMDTVKNKEDIRGLMPDEWDEKNIRRLLDAWNKANPRGKVRCLQDPKDPKKMYLEYLNVYDHIDYMRTVVKQERKLTAILEKRKGDPTHLTLSLPPAFAERLHKAYPTMLTDKRQTAWLLRKFPELNLNK